MCPLSKANSLRWHTCIISLSQRQKSYIVQYGRSGKKNNCHINISWHQVYVNSICKSDYNQIIRNPVVSTHAIGAFN